MKKLILFAASAAMIFGSLTLTSCGGNKDDTGGSTGYVGKAFTFYDVETEDDKPVEQSNDNDTEDDDTDYDFPTDNDIPSEPVKDRTEKETKNWIYFQTESKVVYGTVEYNITYDGSTGEEKDREMVSGSILKKYYGNYTEAITSNENIPLLNLINLNESTKNDDQNWEKIEKPYDVKKGFELTGAAVATKNYEFGVKKGDLIIKLTENKGNYHEWTTWTWEKFTVVDEMNVNSEDFDLYLVETTFSAVNSRTKAFKFKNNGKYERDGSPVENSEWSTLKIKDKSVIKIKNQNNPIPEEYDYYSMKVGELPRYKEDPIGLSCLSEYADTVITFFIGYDDTYIMSISNNQLMQADVTTITNLIAVLQTNNLTLANLLNESDSQNGGFDSNNANDSYDGYKSGNGGYGELKLPY